jgi:hypothetical protein
MKLRHLLCCVLAAVVSAATIAAAQRPPVESDQQILIELERGWNDAFYRKDVAFISNLLADEFVATYDDGSQGDKAKELALATQFNQPLGEKLDFLRRADERAGLGIQHVHFPASFEGRNVIAE